MNPTRSVDNGAVDGPRACLEDELPTLLRAANRVFRPSGGDMGRDYPLLFSPANLAAANLRVIREGDDIIAHAGLCLRTAAVARGGGAGRGDVRVGAVGAVFTRADRRGRGLARAVVADVLARARTGGVDLALISGDGPLYHRLGFSAAPPVACWSCPAPPAPGPQVDVEVEVVPCDQAAGDVEVLARLNDAEPVHFVRTAADWLALLGAETLFAWPARVWMVRSQGRPVGYLAVAQRARRRVLEFAGDRRAILAAASRVSEELVVPWHDSETTHHARRLSWLERPLRLALGSLWLQAPDGSPPGPPVAPWPWSLPWYGLNYV
jgi:predicted N-acetyltransferase YhbS